MSVAKLAKQCGVSGAAPYRHFASRDALLRAVAAVGYAELRDRMGRAAESHSDPVDRLIDMGVAYVEYALQHGHMFRLMFSARVREDNIDSDPHRFEALMATVAQLDLRVPVDVAVRASWGLVHGLADLRASAPPGELSDTPDSDVLRQELRALIGGIASTG